jgi:hypothetical protein
MELKLHGMYEDVELKYWFIVVETDGNMRRSEAFQLEGFTGANSLVRGNPQYEYLGQASELMLALL